jgi:MYXO-CTERM domain-containing protein
MRAALLRSGAVLAVLMAAGAAQAQESEGDEGIAARYPRDVGIDADPAVLFVEDFEATLPEILSRWEDVQSESSMSLTDDVPTDSAGTNSLLMHKTPGDGTNGAHLYRRIVPDGGNGYERLYARMYVKIDTSADVIHHFGTNLGGNNPSTPWPMVSAGNQTDGDVSFWTGIEPYGDAWQWDFYTYWMEMRSWENDDGSGTSFYGNAFLRDTADGNWEPIGPEVRRGDWVSVELMVQVNDLGESNGEQAFWIDGQLVRDDGQIISHLGPGYPNGSWLRDKWSPDPGGEPFEGFRWRSAADLLVNYVWLYVYTEEDSYDIPVWYDDVVVATTYIGPQYTGTASGSGGSGGSGASGDGDAGGPDGNGGGDDGASGADSGDDNGCGCATVGAQPFAARFGPWLSAALLLGLRRRRRDPQ